MVAGGDKVGFATGAAVPDEICCVDDVVCGQTVAFCEFGIDDVVHLKCGNIRLPTVRIFSVRSIQKQSAQRENSFLCVMVGIFDCDGGGGLHGTLLSRKVNVSETKDLVKVFQKTVLSYFYHN